MNTIVKSLETYAESALAIDLDATLFIQAGLFLILLLVLKPALFDPILALDGERKKRSDDLRRRARAEDTKAERWRALHDWIVRDGLLSGAAARDALHQTAQERMVERLARVREENRSIVARGRSAVAEEAKNARTSLRRETRTLGGRIASLALGRDLTS